VPNASIAVTLALFVVVYGIVFWMGIYYINRLIAQGPSRAAVKDTGQFGGSILAALLAIWLLFVLLRRRKHKSS